VNPAGLIGGHLPTTIWGDRMRIRTFKRAGAAVALAAAATLATVVPASAGPAAPGQTAATANYIVTLESDVVPAAEVASTAEDQTGRRPGRVYRSALHGYTARMTAAQASELRDDPSVAAVERDSIVTIADTQPSAPWGLDRVDQRDLPLSTTYTYTARGSGVTAYVVDTGIRFSHRDFGGRAVSGFDAIDGGTADDCNGHGTHVSSTAGGGTYGVAKGVRLVAVRVLDCGGGGSLSGVIAGIDWAVANHQTGQAAVANMSLGGSPSVALDSAVTRLINDGVTVVVAAGNSSANACQTSPARVPAAVTVAASSRTDAFASFSNWGSCVDVIAPGVSITAAWRSSDTATRAVSGTSMASPHTAGAAAKILQGSPGATPATVATTIRNEASVNKVTGVPSGTPNRLLYTAR
jgi:aqualysin 1